MDLEKLRHDLSLASIAACAAAAFVEDGGTCNLDCVIVPTGRPHPIKRRSKALDEVFVAFGGRRIDWGWQGRGYVLSYPAGQAAKRTVATEAAANALRDWKAHVHYHMD